MKKLIFISALGLFLSQASFANGIYLHGGENEGARDLAVVGASADFAAAQTVTYVGWISFDASLNSFTVELQSGRTGVSSTDWAALEFTTAEQESFARAQYSSETRPLLIISGTEVSGTENPAIHKLLSLKVMSITKADSSTKAMSMSDYDSGVDPDGNSGTCLRGSHPSAQCCKETGAMIPACGFTGP